MTEAIRDLLERALKLSPADRVKLADELYASLAEGEDEDRATVEAAWREEIARRLKDVDEGRVQPVDFDEALERIRRELKS